MVVNMDRIINRNAKMFITVLWQNCWNADWRIHVSCRQMKWKKFVRVKSLRGGQREFMVNLHVTGI